MNGKRRGTPIDLEDRERDLSLMDRAEGGASEDAGREAADTRPGQSTAAPSAADELAALRQRIARARQLEPGGHDRRWAHYWRKGRDAALRAIEEVNPDERTG